MKLLLKRTDKRKTYTAGKLYVDGQLFCDTIEDKDRALTQAMPLEEVKRVKVYGQTAIPSGTYEVHLTRSVKFQNRAWAQKWDGAVPELQDVPGFSGVRIHPANTASELLGCIAVGKRDGGSVIQSERNYSLLMERLTAAKGEITIEIA